MKQQRLNNVLVLHVQKKRTNKIELITVANKFFDSSETCLARAGHFYDIDRRCNNVTVTQSVQVSSMKFWLLRWFYFFVYIYFCVIFLCVYFKNWHFWCRYLDYMNKFFRICVCPREDFDDTSWIWFWNVYFENDPENGTPNESEQLKIVRKFKIVSSLKLAVNYSLSSSLLLRKACAIRFAEIHQSTLI